jgi:hypothetical protein
MSTLGCVQCTYCSMECVPVCSALRMKGYEHTRVRPVHLLQHGACPCMFSPENEGLWATRVRPVHLTAAITARIKTLKKLRPKRCNRECLGYSSVPACLHEIITQLRSPESWAQLYCYALTLSLVGSQTYPHFSRVRMHSRGKDINLDFFNILHFIWYHVFPKIMTNSQASMIGMSIMA